jgi:hypothetical protein
MQSQIVLYFDGPRNIGQSSDVTPISASASACLFSKQPAWLLIFINSTVPGHEHSFVSKGQMSARPIQHFAKIPKYRADYIQLELELYISPGASRECRGQLTPPWRVGVNGGSGTLGYGLLLSGAIPGADLALSSLAGVRLSRSATPGQRLGLCSASVVIQNTRSEDCM